MESLFSISVDISKTYSSLYSFEKKHFPFVLSKTLNDTAWQVYWVIRKKEIPKIFDRPTPWTQKAMYVVKSTKKSLFAEVGYKNWATKGTASVKIMGHFVHGGSRPFKRSETLLQQKGIVPKGHFLIQAKAAAKNQYGNIPASKYNQMLSGLGAQLDTAQRSSMTSGRRKTRRNAQRFFAGTPRGGNRSFAIYERLRGKIRPLFFISSKANYKKRYEIQKMVNGIVRHEFPKFFERNMAEALRTAK